MKVSALLSVICMTSTGQAFGRSDTTQPPTRLLARYVHNSAALEQALIMQRNVPPGPVSLSARAFAPQHHFVSSLVKRASPPGSPRGGSTRGSSPSSPRRSEVTSGERAARPNVQPVGGLTGPPSSAGVGGHTNAPNSAGVGGRQQSPTSFRSYLPSRENLPASRAALGTVAATGAIVSIAGLTDWSQPSQAATSLVGMSCIGAAAATAACLGKLHRGPNSPTNRQTRPGPSAAGNTGGGAAGSSLEMSNVPLRGPGNVASDDPSNLVRRW